MPYSGSTAQADSKDIPIKQTQTINIELGALIGFSLLPLQEHTVPAEHRNYTFRQMIRGMVAECDLSDLQSYLTALKTHTQQLR